MLSNIPPIASCLFFFLPNPLDILTFVACKISGVPKTHNWKWLQSGFIPILILNGGKADSLTVKLGAWRFKCVCMEQGECCWGLPEDSEPRIKHCCRQGAVEAGSQIGS